MIDKDQFLTWLEQAFEHSNFWAGYRRGLNRLYFGDRFGTDKEHWLWYNVRPDEPDLTRRARGEGYRAGFAGIDPAKIFLKETMIMRKGRKEQ